MAKKFGGVTQFTNEHLLELVPMKAGGPTLAFGTYPVVLSTLPCPQFWNIMFFATLYFLGVDSAFSLLEGVSTYLSDTELLKNVPRKIMTTVLTAVLFLITLIYMTDAGLTLLDVVDYYLNFTLLFIGLMEVILAGWLFRFEETVEVCGKVPALMLAGSVFAPTLIGCIVGFSLAAEKGDSPAAIQSGVGACLFLGCVYFAVTIFVQQFHGDTSFTYLQRVEELLVGNTEFMRNYINSEYLKSRGLEDKWWRGVPKYFWSICIKYICNIALLILTFNYAAARNANEVPVFGRYSGYAAQWQVIGLFAVSIIVGSTVIGLVIPEKYTRWSVNADADPLRNGGSALESMVPSDYASASFNKGVHQRKNVAPAEPEPEQAL